MKRHNPTLLREQVYRRDHGVCANCGYPAGSMEEALETAHACFLAWAPTTDAGTRVGWANVQVSLLRHLLGLPLTGTLWEADHIHPLHLGGADDLGNSQTLCKLGCHQPKSGMEAKFRGKAERLVKKAPRKHLGFRA